MSILTQILRDMYIEPDLLAELSEEQKQLLFCKMREEQIRLWAEREKKLEDEAKKKKKKPAKPVSTKKKTVSFLNGLDNKEWVWVMGEHKNDKTIDEILEEEAKTKAAKQAEIDALKLREMEEAEVKRQLKAEEDRIKREHEEKELLAKKKAEEAAIYQSLKEARLAAKKLEEERIRLEKEERERLEALEMVKRRESVRTLEQLKSERKNDLYKTWKQLRESMEKDAIESSQKVDEEWQEQEKRSKEAEKKIRDLARKARAEHRKSVNSACLLDGTQSLPNFARKNAAPAPPLPLKTSKETTNKVMHKSTAPRPPRPTSKDSVIRWFRDEEMHKGMEMDAATGKPEVWFHGIISRVEAEELLVSALVGSFLVRVSEKIWGYTITYKEETRCKHFLVDATDGKYHFFGTDQMKHATLRDLIIHHQTTPISLEQEILVYPCGQVCDPPDYHELYSTHHTEHTAF